MNEVQAMWKEEGCKAGMRWDAEAWQPRAGDTVTIDETEVQQSLLYGRLTEESEEPHHA